jgi:hypothetical protein
VLSKIGIAPPGFLLPAKFRFTLNKPPFILASALTVVFALLMLATPSFARAVVLFDSNTATGFTDASDLLQMLGWSDPDLYSRHSALTFQYRGTEKLALICQWSVPSSGARGDEPRLIEQSLIYRVVSMPVFDTGNGKKINRFQFLGREQADFAADPLRLRGQPCVSATGVPGQINSVQRISAMGSLYVNFQGMNVRLTMNSQ